MAASTIDFTKLVHVAENVNIDKTIDVHSFVLFNSAMANANAEAVGRLDAHRDPDRSGGRPGGGLQFRFGVGSPRPTRVPDFLTSYDRLIGG